MTLTGLMKAVKAKMETNKQSASVTLIEIGYKTCDCRATKRLSLKSAKKKVRFFSFLELDQY